MYSENAMKATDTFTDVEPCVSDMLNHKYSNVHVLHLNDGTHQNMLKLLRYKNKYILMEESYENKHDISHIDFVGLSHFPEYKHNRRKRCYNSFYSNVDDDFGKGPHYTKKVKINDDEYDTNNGDIIDNNDNAYNSYYCYHDDNYDCGDDENDGEHHPMDDENDAAALVLLPIRKNKKNNLDYKEMILNNYYSDNKIPSFIAFRSYILKILQNVHCDVQDIRSIENIIFKIHGKLEELLSPANGKIEKILKNTVVIINKFINKSLNNTMSKGHERSKNMKSLQKHILKIIFKKD